VFRGGFTLSALAAVSGQDGVLDDAEALVDRSMVVLERLGAQSRYRLLEPLRHFAADVAGTAEAAELKTAHARFFVALAEQIGIGYVGPDHQSAQQTLELEFANLRMAHQHLLRIDDLEGAAELLGGIAEAAAYRMLFEVLSWFDAAQTARAAAVRPLADDVDHLPLTALFEAGRLDEVRKLTGRVLRSPAARDQTRVLAHVIAAWSQANQGRQETVIEHLDAAVARARGHGHPYWLIEALASRSQMATRIGARHDIAQRAGRQAIDLAEAYGNQSQLTLAYGLSHSAASTETERIDLLRRGVAAGQASGNLLMTGVCAYQLGDHLARRDGSLAAAAGQLVLAIDLFNRSRVLTQLWNVLEITAQRWAEQGEKELPLLIWGCLEAHGIRPITAMLPTTPAARGRDAIVAGALAQCDPTLETGRRLDLDVLVDLVVRKLAEVAESKPAEHRSPRISVPH
jgi:hypothetical protein